MQAIEALRAIDAALNQPKTYPADVEYARCIVRQFLNPLAVMQPRETVLVTSRVNAE